MGWRSRSAVRDVTRPDDVEWNAVVEPPPAGGPERFLLAAGLKVHHLPAASSVALAKNCGPLGD